MKNELGAFIRSRRGTKSLRDFAEQIGISHSHLDSIEKGYDPKTGKPVNISLDVLAKLAKILNVEEIAMLYLNKGIISDYLKQCDEIYKSLEELGIDISNLDTLPDGEEKEEIKRFFSERQKIDIGKLQLQNLVRNNFSDDDIVEIAKNSNIFKDLNDTEIKQLLNNIPKVKVKNGEIYAEDSEILMIPVYGTIKAGIPIESQSDIIDYVDIPKQWTNGGKKFYGLKISGDSMFPKYSENDIVIFEQNDDIEAYKNKDVAVMINGTESTFKKILVNEQGIVLQPYNMAYEIMMFSKEQVEQLPIKIVGIAREKRTKID